MSSFNPRYSHSPQSSSGAADSGEGTPDTRLTSFSPEDARPVKPANAKPTGTPLKAGQQDPFVTTNSSSKSKGEQKLSATASAFQPFGLRIGSSYSTPVATNASAALPGTIQYLDGVIAAQLSLGRGKQHPELTQQGTFSTDTGATRCIKIANIYDGEVFHLVEASMNKLLKSGDPLRGTYRLDSMGNITYLRLSNISDAASVYTAIKLDNPGCAVEYVSPKTFGQIVSPNSKTPYSAHEGQVVLRASYPTNTPFDKKEFEESLRFLLSAEGKLFAWQKLSATEAGAFRMVAEFDNASLAPRAVNRCNGKRIGTVIVSVQPHAPDVTVPLGSHRLAPSTTPTRISEEDLDINEGLGQMSLNNSQAPHFHGSTELFAGTAQSPTALYMASNAAFTILANTVPVVMGGLYSPSPITSFQQSYSGAMNRQPYLGGSGFNAFASPGYYNQAYAQNGLDLHGFNVSGFQHNNHPDFGFLNPQSPVSLRDLGAFNQSGGRRQNAIKVPHHSMTRGRQYSNPAAGHHNRVDIHRIRQGIDVRTTVMLRNIPNKVDQAMLKSIIDESSFGRYDFMYLRIDFSNDCNVGYAFINFNDPLDIIEFVLTRSNQKWHRFKSDKVAEVSYATIQGRDCLIQKFRNSSVMLEPPHYRPKLFFTIHDPFGRVGEEDQFPASDNASKLKRSCENAEHVGLFAPSAGQHLRDEQRRRRSRYDRGTSLAEREEFGYDDDATEPPYPGNPPY